MTRENSTGSELIRNLIPDDMRLIIDSQPGENITGANFLTRTAAGQVVTPSGQAVQPGTDLIQIANDFDNTVKSELDADSFQIPEALLRNSLKSGVTNPVPVESLTTTLIELGKTKVFDENQGESVFGRIWGASLGALQDKLVDADDADNLIEVEPVDAGQLGGLRAWAGNDLILGTDPDLLLGTHDGNDIVNGNAGSDKILGAGGNDLLMGGQDNDVIAGGKGDDLLMGQKGNDELFGGAGKDVIGGGKGSDLLMGNDGNDILISGGGDEGDFLIGAEGADEFILRTETLATDAALANRIGDFNPLEGDRIKIAHFDGTQAMLPIRFAAVDVNLDNIQDTAILCSDGGVNGSVNRVVGVILGKDSTPLDLNNLQSSIFMVNPKDAALSMIGDIF